jgi:hypothetical protein
MRKAETYWSEHHDVRHVTYEKKLNELVIGPSKTLLCALNQFNFKNVMSHPETYHPVCWEVLATVRKMRVRWPPTGKIRHYVEALRLFGDYQRFLNLIISYMSHNA